MWTTRFATHRGCAQTSDRQQEATEPPQKQGHRLFVLGGQLLRTLPANSVEWQQDQQQHRWKRLGSQQLAEQQDLQQQYCQPRHSRCQIQIHETQDRERRLRPLQRF